MVKLSNNLATNPSTPFDAKIGIWFVGKYYPILHLVRHKQKGLNLDVLV